MEPAPTQTDISFGPYTVPNAAEELRSGDKTAATFVGEYLQLLDINSMAEFRETYEHRSPADLELWRILLEWVFLTREELTSTEELRKRILGVAFSHTPRIANSMTETMKPIAIAE